MMRIYTYEKCDSCRKAVKWLVAEQIDFEQVAIRETPPNGSELRAALAANAGNLRRLYNVSGREYRALGIADKLAVMTVDEALELLASNGHLVKRPFVVGEGVALVGFDPGEWRRSLTKEVSEVE